jgi:hypothetical protein
MTKRETQIKILEAVIAKNDAAFTATRLTLGQMEANQVNRLGELRFQKLLAQAEAKRAAEAKTI